MGVILAAIAGMSLLAWWRSRSARRRWARSPHGAVAPAAVRLIDGQDRRGRWMHGAVDITVGEVPTWTARKDSLDLTIEFQPDRYRVEGIRSVGREMISVSPGFKIVRLERADGATEIALAPRDAEGLVAVLGAARPDPPEPLGGVHALNDPPDELDRGLDPIGVIEAAKQFFIGVPIDGHVGHDIVQDGASVILLLRDAATDALLGVRFPVPSLPSEGLAYAGIWMRTPKDWILDLRVVLAEEIATGALFTGVRVEHAGWIEHSVAPERWVGLTGEHPVRDWEDR